MNSRVMPRSPLRRASKWIVGGALGLLPAAIVCCGSGSSPSCPAPSPTPDGGSGAQADLTLSPTGCPCDGVVVEPGPAYTFPLPLECDDMKDCPASDLPTCAGSKHFLHNSGQSSAAVAYGFEFSPTIANGAASGPAGFFVDGGSQGTEDSSQMTVFFVNPYPGDTYNGDNEFGLTMHTGNSDAQHEPGQLYFYYQYMANLSGCQTGGVVPLTTAMGFQPAQAGTCFQVMATSSGDYSVTQYTGACGGSSPQLATITVPNCSMPGSPKKCPPPSQSGCPEDPNANPINFYTGTGTYTPPASGMGTNGFLYATSKKIQGEEGWHNGSSLSGTFQVLSQ